MSVRVVICKPAADYSLWLRFDDGVHGSVHLENLLELFPFSAWRDLRLFLTARADPETGTIVWPHAGVRLDAEILYFDLAVRGGKRAAPPRADPGFVRFMQRAIEPRRRK